MPHTRCSVCTSPDRDAIDQEIIRGGSYRAIGDAHGLGRMSVQRHAVSHLPKTLVRAAGVAEVARADGLLGEVQALQARASALLASAERVVRSAERTRDQRTILRGVASAATTIRELRGLTELLGRLAGELRSESVTLVVSPQWIEVKTVILAALTPHPQALRAVEAALGKVRDV
jgi:hypothetical protein